MATEHPHFALFVKIAALDWRPAEFDEFYALYARFQNELMESSRVLFTQMSNQPLTSREEMMLVRSTAGLSRDELVGTLRKMPEADRRAFAETVLTEPPKSPAFLPINAR